MSATGWLIVSCLLAMLASLSGGWLPNLVRFTHRRTQMLSSLVGGLMIGIALFVMLPHAIEMGPSIDHATHWLMAGLLLMFLLLRMFHFHHHGSFDGTEDEMGHGLSCGHSHDHRHGHGQATGPELLQLGAFSATSETPAPAAQPSATHDHSAVPNTALRWVGMSIGLGIHTFVDGVALAAQIQADASLGHGGWLGLGTLLAIVLHKPMDSMAITSLMAAGGWSVRAQWIMNFAYACTLPLGAVVFSVSVGGLGSLQNAVIGAALAFAAGAFLCIALADLLPEVQFHSHDRLWLSCLLLLGVGAAYATELLHHSGHSHDGPGHSHAHDHGAEPAEKVEHSGHSHSHDDHGHEGHDHKH